LFALEPPVDDLSTSRGVVLSRAATILRSIETQPLTGGCLGREVYRGRRNPVMVRYRRGKKRLSPPYINVRGNDVLFRRLDVSLH
jgi:hypothetical protein